MRYLLGILMCIVVTGCGGNHTVRKAEYLGKERLYINLEADNDKFNVYTLNSSSGDYLLNDLSPTFSTREQDCGDWSYIGPTKNSKCDYEKTHFRYTSIRPMSPIVNTIGMFGLNIFFGYHHRDSYFDADKHWLSTNEALVNAGINRAQLFSRYDSFIDKRNDTNTKLSQLANSRYIGKITSSIAVRPDGFVSLLQEKEKTFDSYYLDAVNYDNFLGRMKLKKAVIDDIKANYLQGASKIQPAVTVTDNSGYYRDNIKFAKFFRVVPRKISNYAAEPTTISLGASDFSNFAKEYEKGLDSHIEQQQGKAKSYDLNLSKERKLQCFNFDISSPEKAESQLQEQSVPVKVTINSRDFSDVYTAYSNKDNFITVDFDGESLTFRNRSKEFVRIMTVSVYRNDIVNSVKFGEDSKFELAPETSIKEDPYQFMYSDFEAMTEKIARETEIKFGLAVKYRIVNQNQDKSLYDVRKYNLAKILKEKEFPCKKQN